MAFRLVDASPQAACSFVDAARRRGRLWPVYETSELLMARAELAEKDRWQFSAGDFTYFFFVETGLVSLLLDRNSLSIEQNQAIEITENHTFELANAFPSGPSYVIMLAGREVLPGSFFNSFNSAYLNTQQEGDQS
jgi:hypothetical protein